MAESFALLSQLGLKPTEIMILLMLWQNIRTNKSLLDKLVEKVSQLELKLKGVSAE